MDRSTILAAGLLLALIGGGALYVLNQQEQGTEQEQPSPVPEPVPTDDSATSGEATSEPAPEPSPAPSSSPSPATAPQSSPQSAPSQTPPPPPPLSPPPAPQPQSFTVEADDNTASPSTITVPKGTSVTLTFKVKTANVYSQGLDFRSSVVNSGQILPGAQKTVTFTANNSFTFVPYWPGSNVEKDSKVSVIAQ